MIFARKTFGETMSNAEDDVASFLFDFARKNGFEICIYGGYVRDLLRGKPFSDIDVQVPSSEFDDAIVRELKKTRSILELTKTLTMDHPQFSTTEYSCTKMVIKTPSLKVVKIDLSYSRATSLGPDSLRFCDFTVNNLTLSKFGEISTRVKAYEIGQAKNYTDAQWLVKCIRDVIEGKLVWMIPDRFSKSMGANEVSRAVFMEKMQMRLMKMLSKGFTLADEEFQHLTSFRLVV